MNARLSNRRPGFTLIEIMLAIGLFAGVMAAIYGCWSAVVRGSRAGLDAAADVQRGRIAQQAIEDSLTTAKLFVENVRHYQFYGETAGDFSFLSFVARLPDSFPGARVFGDQAMRRVTFAVEPGPNNSRQLVMTQAPYLYATNANQEPYSIVLAKNVTVFMVQFWDTNAPIRAASGGGQWSDEWPYSNRFPAKIQYALGLDSARKERGAAPYLITGIVTMPASAVTSDFQRLNSGGVPGAGRPGTRPQLPTRPIQKK